MHKPAADIPCSNWEYTVGIVGVLRMLLAVLAAWTLVALHRQRQVLAGSVGKAFLTSAFGKIVPLDENKLVSSCRLHHVYCKQQPPKAHPFGASGVDIEAHHPPARAFTFRPN